MNKVLIFGVTGQCGSLFADLALSKNCEVWGVARRTSTPNDRNIKHLYGNDNFHLVSGDITDYSSVQEIIHKIKPKYIVNFSAQSHVGESFKQPLLTWDITGKAVLNILEAIRQSYIYPKFVQLSSSEMFGNNSDVGGFINENTLFAPRSPYAIAKCAGHYAVSLYRSYGLHCSSAICFNMESHRRGETFVTRKITKYIGENYKDIVNGVSKNKLKLGNISAFRDWTYAGDTMNGIWLMLQQLNPDDYVFASGETHSVEEFLDMAFSHIGANYKDFVEIDSSLYRPAEVHRLLGDASKAKEKLGWKPTLSFKELVHHMVDSDIRSFSGNT